MTTTTNSRLADATKLAVLAQKVDDLRDDVKEVKGMVGDKIATREYVNDRIGPLKRLVYWLVGLFGTLIVGVLVALIGVVFNK